MAITALSYRTFETERLFLRRLVSGDANEIFKLRSNAIHNRDIDRPLASSIDDAKVFIDRIDSIVTKGEGWFWAISLKGETALAGTIGIWNFDEENNKAETGYELLDAYQGKGIMQEALAKVLSFSLAEAGFSKIEAWTHPENARSIALLKKFNFQRDHTAEQLKPAGANELIYSLVANDYTLTQAK
jgi:ribosomal-protein-alanine N-acetyltransferase